MLTPRRKRGRKRAGADGALIAGSRLRPAAGLQGGGRGELGRERVGGVGRKIQRDQRMERHPEFDARVFSPKEKKGYFLVALGGRMSREDALRLQKKARTEGVARDVYVQNYLD